MTDTSGSQIWNCFYYPFGEQKWPESEQMSNSHQFTGKEYDTEISLNYFCQRYYDPTIGRFMSLDPIAGYLENPQTQNRYGYCINNPLKYIDPLGLWPRWLSKHNPEGYEEVVGWSGGSECVVTANRPYRPGRSLIGNLPGQDPLTRGWGWANTGKGWYSSATWDTESGGIGWRMRGEGGHFTSGTGQTRSYVDVATRYYNFMAENYPKYYSTFPPLGYGFRNQFNREVWTCDQWADALTCDLNSRGFPGWRFSTMWLQMLRVPPYVLIVTRELVTVPGFRPVHSFTVGTHGAFLMLMDPFLLAPLLHGRGLGFFK